ncbi:MAG: metal ABC transporter substrate-binding protein [Tepidisphaeraceae bacterium]
MIILLVAVLLIAGCERTPDPPSAVPAQEPIHVLGTVYALADLARQIGGKYAVVDWVVESGQSLTGMQGTPELRDRLRRADFLVAGGITEPWVVEGSGDPTGVGNLVRMDSLAPEIARIESSADLWLDPVVAQQLCDELARRFSTVRPQHEAYFRANADRVKQQLASLTREYMDRLGALPTRKAISLSPEFDLLAQRFNIILVRTFNGAPELLTDAQVRQLRDDGALHDVGCLIISTDTPDAIARDLSNRASLRPVALDAYGSSAAAARGTYQELLRFNLQGLFEALETDARARARPSR